MTELPKMCGNSQNFILSLAYSTWYNNAIVVEDENEVPVDVLESGIVEVVEDVDTGVSAVDPSSSPVATLTVTTTTLSGSAQPRASELPTTAESETIVDRNPAYSEVLVDELNNLAHELDDLSVEAVFTPQSGGWHNLEDSWKVLPSGIRETHVPGRVEVATRVVHGLKPSEVETMSKDAEETGVGSRVAGTEEERVEEELKTKFGRAIMRPWAADIDGRTYCADIPRPVVDELVDSSSVNMGPHNPFRDDIEVVFRDEEVKGLMLCWGVKGTFVQLVRRSLMEGGKVKEVAGENTTRGKLWFMVRYREIFPTYYAAMED